MKEVILQKAIKLAKASQSVIIATSDKEGLPHVAIAGYIKQNPQGLLEVTSWFCPGTVSNIAENPFISIVIWDEKKDYGWQLLGETVDIVVTGMLNGYVPEIEEKKPFPQVERKLIVRINKVMEFAQKPHMDLER